MFQNITSYSVIMHIFNLSVIFHSVQFSSSVDPTLCDMDCSTPGLPVHHQLPKSTQTHVHLVCDAIQPSHPLSSPSCPALNLSQHWGLFKWVSSLHQVDKILEFQLQHQSFHEYSDLFPSGWTGWISLQSKRLSTVFSNTNSSKASILLPSAFLIVQLSHPYVTTGKTVALTRWTFVGTVMSLLFNMLSRLVITFLPRSKHLLISWLQSPSAVILEPPKIKSATVCTVSWCICQEMMGPDAMILVFWMFSFKATFLLSSFIFIKRLFSFSSLSAIRVVSSECLRLLIFLLAILIRACASSSQTFLMMYSACKLNTQGDNIQPWCIPFPIWNQSVVSCPVLTVASWPAYRFLRRQIKWSGIPISLRVFHSWL